jgi:peptidyl-prolyl cis-trans isomerase B (cyclophilin B)
MFPQLELTKITGPQVTLITSLGKIQIQLFPEQAPKAVENFVKLSSNNYYQQTIFHRVINDFMIQGGDPTGTGRGGESYWHHSFANEASDKLFNFRGALAMANAGPDTNGSQFYLVQNQHLQRRFIKQMQAQHYPAEVIDKYRHGGAPWLDGKYTVFGQVISGMSVVDQIAKVKTDYADKPLETVTLEQVVVNDC